jgi:cytochrome bd-type quinol oxidase subunit 1
LNIEELRRLLPEIQDLFDSYPSGVLGKFGEPFKWENPVSTFCTRNHMKKESEYSLNIYRWANHLLCYIFNRFPPSLCHVNGWVYEMPKISPSGIRPTLYHMLRREYLKPRELRLCGNLLCGLYYALAPANVGYCSDSCAERAKQQRHRKRARSTQHK